IKGIGGCWLVTLNCCEGSKATKDQPSLSFALVTRGVAAATAMLEEVAPQDAHDFCGYYYDSVLQTLRDAYDNGSKTNQIERIELPISLYEARNALNAPGRLARNGQPAWTLPVVYVRKDPFMIRVLTGPAPSAESTARAAILKGAQEALSAHALDSAQAADLVELLKKLLQPTPPVPPA